MSRGRPPQCRIHCHCACSATSAQLGRSGCELSPGNLGRKGSRNPGSLPPGKEIAGGRLKEPAVHICIDQVRFPAFLTKNLARGLPCLAFLHPPSANGSLSSFGGGEGSKRPPRVFLLLGELSGHLPEKTLPNMRAGCVSRELKEGTVLPLSLKDFLILPPSPPNRYLALNLIIQP